MNLCIVIFYCYVCSLQFVVYYIFFFFFFQAEDGIRDLIVTGVQTCALPISRRNLSDAGLSNARVETSPVGDWLARNARQLGPVDFVLLDPPRAGAGAETEIGRASCRERV